MKETKIYIMMVGSIPKVQQLVSQTSNLNSAYLHPRYIYTKKLTMAQFSKPKLVNKETYPNTSCKFSNITGGKYCEKCRVTFTGGTQ